MNYSTTNKPVLILKKVIHKRQVRLLLIFKYNDSIISKVRDLKLFIWSKSLRGWHSKYSLDNLNLIYKVLSEDVIFKNDSSIYDITKGLLVCS